MLTVKETDSFSVELSKNFAQSMIGTVVATAGMIGGFAIVGAALGRWRLKVVQNDEMIVPKNENQE